MNDIKNNKTSSKKFEHVYQFFSDSEELPLEIEHPLFLNSSSESLIFSEDNANTPNPLDISEGRLDQPIILYIFNNNQ